ncbi:TspO/MBR family protein [Leuconostoc pseudomesenteroides]|uniref:TspO/MBR family protein n=1 Tax=Leuconostoc pseudomesenteroides TaxID=33968 RepID=UPI001122C56A|nr:TspO/MBR family protein [Leuconostoc pseudomesenteroides]TOZ06659.1 sensory protein [Leuconostoc pseudomesenteroides]
MVIKKWQHVALLVGMVVVVEAIGGLSALLAGDIKQIYNQLVQPPLSPPDFVFGIVWPILYLLIGVAAYLLIVSQYHAAAKKTNLLLFALQLFVNFIWSIVFFGGNLYWIGVPIILVLDALVIACIVNFRRNQLWASYLMYPYLAWILFAAYLTIAVAILN